MMVLLAVLTARGALSARRPGGPGTEPAIMNDDWTNLRGNLPRPRAAIDTSAPNYRPQAKPLLFIYFVLARRPVSRQQDAALCAGFSHPTKNSVSCHSFFPMRSDSHVLGRRPRVPQTCCRRCYHMHYRLLQLAKDRSTLLLKCLPYLLSISIEQRSNFFYMSFIQLRLP